jgi:hypothetical protein
MRDDQTGDIFAYTPPPEAHARHSDPETSHEAAECVSPHVQRMQRAVLEFAGFAVSADGFTDVSMNRYFQTTGSSYRSRRAELVEKGLIRDSGERHTYGENGKGRRHIIWQITLAGLNELRG